MIDATYSPSTKPLLYPNPLHRWESLNVFNCAVIQHNGLFHMHYRAQGVDFISHIGYAVSTDGLRWNRLEFACARKELKKRGE